MPSDLGIICFITLKLSNLRTDGTKSFSMDRCFGAIPSALKIEEDRSGERTPMTFLGNGMLSSSVGPSWEEGKQ